MNDITTELGFYRIDTILCNYNLKVEIDEVENIYVKHPSLPKLQSFESTMSVSQIINKSILILLAEGKYNVLSTGYTKVGRYFTDLQLRCAFPNTTTNFFKHWHWSVLLKSLGDELSVFLLTRCSIIEKINNKNVLLAGDIRKIKGESNRNMVVNRHAIFHKMAGLQRLEYEHVIRIFEHNCTYVEEKNTGCTCTNECTQCLYKQYETASACTANKLIYKGGFSTVSCLFPRRCCVRYENIQRFVDAYKKLRITPIFKCKFQKENTLGENTDILEHQVNPKKLVEFLFCISKRILSGCISFYNFRILKSKLTLFIARNKFESLTFHEIRKYFRLNDTKLFRSRRCTGPEFCKRANVFVEFMVFLFERIYIPIMSKYFHATETSFSKLKVVYFTRKIWNTLSESSIREFLANYEAAEADGSFNKIRAIPKKKGFRIVVNVCRRRGLRSVHAILLEELKGCLGNSVLKYREANQRIQEYRTKCSQPLLLKFDLEKCFDNIPHDKLRNVLTSIFKKKEYYIKKFYILEKISGTLRLRQARRCANRSVSMAEIVRTEKVQKNQIICDSIFDEERNSAQTLAEIEDTLFKNIIKHRGRFYKQTKGIPQGSMLSPIVCSLYFAYIDMQLLDDIVKDGIVMRYIDDFIVITPTLREIYAYLEAIKGLRHFGMALNNDKIESTFVLEEPSSCRNARLRPVTNYVTWCGMRIFSAGIGVKCAFNTRFLQHSFAFGSSTGGLAVFHKLQRLLQRRMSIVFVNPSNVRTFENIYDTFFIIGTRLMLLLGRIDFVNVNFVRKICKTFVQYTHRDLRRKSVFISKQKVRIIAKKALQSTGLHHILK
eukprot:jgi/Antlo1/416/904